MVFSWIKTSITTTFCLRASHFSPNIDLFVGTTTTSVLVLFSPEAAAAAAACCIFFVLVLLSVLSSSLTISKPFFAKFETFDSFNFWKADETAGEADETVDLSFEKISLYPNCPCWLVLAVEVSWAELSAEEVLVWLGVDSEPWLLPSVVCSFPRPKVSFT